MILFPVGVVNFNSKHGCQKCTTFGCYCKKFKRVYFPDSNALSRTDADFRARKYGEHYKERSSLENLDIDMIHSFPSSDPLHLLDLGIMKRCLIRWRERLWIRIKYKTPTIRTSSSTYIIEKSQLQGSNPFHTQMFTPQVSNPRIHANSRIFGKVQICPDVILNSKKCADSRFLTKTDQIVRMVYAKVENNKIKIMGHALQVSHAAFTFPIDSTRLKIFASNADMIDDLSIYDLDSIASKIMCLPYKDENIFIPILHTMDSLSLGN